MCIRNLFWSSHLSSLLKTKQRQYLSLSSDIFKSSFLLMPPFSFWHVLAHPHLSKGLKRPNTRVKQKLPVQLLFFFQKGSPSRQWTQFSHQHRGFYCHLNCPTDLPSCSTGHSSLVAVYSLVPQRCLGHQKQQKWLHDQITQLISLCLLTELDKK